jgi:HTH-type transcriptional regulator/antitoxin HigA
MTAIKTQKEYEAMLARIEELLPLTWGDNVAEDSPENIELALISNLVADYEDIHYPIGKPTLVATIKLRMFEMELTQTKVAAMLGISAPRLSEIMHGKVEPSLSLARKISQTLNISPSIVLGV